MAARRRRGWNYRESWRGSAAIHRGMRHKLRWRIRARGRAVSPGRGVRRRRSTRNTRGDVQRSTGRGTRGRTIGSTGRGRLHDTRPCRDDLRFLADRETDAIARHFDGDAQLAQLREGKTVGHRVALDPLHDAERRHTLAGDNASKTWTTLPR